MVLSESEITFLTNAKTITTRSNIIKLNLFKTFFEMKLFNVVFFTVTILSHFVVNVSAHETLEEPFLFLNEQVLELKENLNPKTYILEHYEHYIPDFLDLNTGYRFEIDTEIVKENLEKDEDLIVIWKYEDQTLKNTVLNLSYETHKSLVIEFSIFSSSEELLSESFLVNFGSSTITEPKYKINGEEVLETKIVGIEGYKLNFEVINASPDIEYSWEIAGKEVVKGSNFEHILAQDTIFPFYIRLRATDLNTTHFKDTFVKIEKLGDGFKINTPPDVNPKKEEEKKENEVLVSIAVIVLVVALGGVIIWRRKN